MPYSASTVRWARRALLVSAFCGGTTAVALAWPRQDRTPLAAQSSPLQYVNLGASLIYYHFGHYIRPFVDPEKAHRQAIEAASMSRTKRLILGLVLPELRYESLECTPFEQKQTSRQEAQPVTARNGLLNAAVSTPTPPLKQLLFAHPLGLAAGFDKHAEAIDGLLDMGFSFVEIGSVTPLPQEGNPKPRVFRLEEDRAIINRYGFNSDGADRVAERLEQRTLQHNVESHPRTGVLGVNLGKNKESPDAAIDYKIGVDKLAPYADYLVVNVSSPNTPGLRALQQKSELFDLLSSVKQRRDALFTSLRRPAPPLLVKIAPDLTEADKDDIASVCLSLGLDGLVISNTTIARPKELRSPNQIQSGGLSGAPLKHVSTDLIRDMYRRTNGSMVIIGVGGVESGVDAYNKIKAGASLVQVYSNFALKGPYQLHCIKRDLDILMHKDGFKNIKEAVGIDVRREKGEAPPAEVTTAAATATTTITK